MRDNWDMIPDDEMDDLFREAADGFKPSFDAEAWRRMEAKLDAQQQPRSVLKRYWWALGVLLLLLTGAGTYLYTKKSTSVVSGISGLAPKGRITAAKTPKAAQAGNIPTDHHLGTAQINNTPNDKQLSQAESTTGEISSTDLRTHLAPIPTKTTKQTMTAGVKKDSKGLGSKDESPAASPVELDTRKATGSLPQTSDGKGFTPPTAASTTLLGESLAGFSKKTVNQQTKRTNRKERKTAQVLQQPQVLNTDATPSQSVDVVSTSEAANTKTSNNIDATTEASSNYPERLAIKALELLHPKFTLVRPVFELPYIEPATLPTTTGEVTTVQRPRFGIRLIAAPDFNQVGAANPMAMGTSLGLGLEYEIVKRLRVQVAAIKSKKTYGTPMSEYSPPAGTWKYGTKPDWVDANCKILDIPINIRWDALRRNRYDFFVSTGLSSYLMLNERYDYQYPAGTATQHLTTWWEKKRASNHWLSTYNLSVGYERQFRRGFTIQIEPYLKMPLQGVGFGRVNILSTGLLFSTKYQFK